MNYYGFFVSVDFVAEMIHKIKLSKNLNMTKNPIEKWLSTNLPNLETLKSQNNGQHNKYTCKFPWQPPFIINVGNIINILADLDLKQQQMQYILVYFYIFICNTCFSCYLWIMSADWRQWWCLYILYLQKLFLYLLYIHWISYSMTCTIVFPFLRQP